MVIQVIKVIPNPHGSPSSELDAAPLFPPTAEFETDARGIAAELERLHQDGAIANKSVRDPDARFCANLLREFGATYTGPRSIKQIAVNQNQAGGNPHPGVCVPGKPCTPTVAQRVRIPRGVSRQKEREFLARDLEETLSFVPKMRIATLESSLQTAYTSVRRRQSP